MSSPLQPTSIVVASAGLVRIAELGRQLLYLDLNHQPTDRVVRSIIDLRQKLEALALTTDPAQQAVLAGDIQETYGLLAVYSDPLLRPLVPTLAAGGNELRPLVLSFNGKVLTVNGKALVVHYRITAGSTVPTFNTVLISNQSVGGFSYASVSTIDTAVSVNTPVDLTVLNPNSYINISVGGQLMGKLDFPPAAAGAPFALRVQAVTYYGILPDVTVTGNSYALS